MRYFVPSISRRNYPVVIVICWSPLAYDVPAYLHLRCIRCGVSFAYLAVHLLSVNAWDEFVFVNTREEPYLTTVVSKRIRAIGPQVSLMLRFVVAHANKRFRLRRMIR